MSSTDAFEGRTHENGHLAGETKRGLRLMGREAQRVADELGSQTAEQVSAIGEGLKAGAERIDAEMGWGGEQLRGAAERLSTLAESLRTKSAQEVVADIRDLAQSRPAIFYGACAIVGFALGRFLTASEPDASDSFTDDLESSLGDYRDEVSGGDDFRSRSDG